MNGDSPISSDRHWQLTLYRLAIAVVVALCLIVALFWFAFRPDPLPVADLMTATYTATPTASQTATGTATGPPTTNATATNTRSSTVSPSATLTALPTASRTPRSTRTPTATDASTATATQTSTATLLPPLPTMRPTATVQAIPHCGSLSAAAGFCELPETAPPVARKRLGGSVANGEMVCHRVETSNRFHGLICTEVDSGD